MTAGRFIVMLERDQRSLRPGEPEKWNATLGDKPLLRRVRDPEHDACRALLAKGITGKVTFVHKSTGMAGLTMDVEKSAGRTVRETTKDGRPRTVKFVPFGDAISSSASTDGLDRAELPEAAE